MSRKRVIITVIVLLCIAFAGIASVFGINAYVKNAGGSRLIAPESGFDGADCILVLGCQVRSDGTPSDMLYDRIRRGVELYEKGAAPKIIMSGDPGTVGYDEVNTMKEYAIALSVPSSDVFMDHAGFSTYESLYRAKEIFKADKIIVVSQEYHLYRALYIAEKLGIDAYGVGSDYHVYRGQSKREVREILARCKDFVKVIFKPEPTYLGEAIPVSGDGDNTNDSEDENDYSENTSI